MFVLRQPFFSGSRSQENKHVCVRDRLPPVSVLTGYGEDATVCVAGMVKRQRCFRSHVFFRSPANGEGIRVGGLQLHGFRCLSGEPPELCGGVLMPSNHGLQTKVIQRSFDEHVGHRHSVIVSDVMGIRTPVHVVPQYLFGVFHGEHMDVRIQLWRVRCPAGRHATMTKIRAPAL